MVAGSRRHGCRTCSATALVEQDGAPAVLLGRVAARDEVLHLGLGGFRVPGGLPDGSRPGGAAVGAVALEADHVTAVGGNPVGVHRIVVLELPPVRHREGGGECRGVDPLPARRERWGLFAAGGAGRRGGRAGGRRRGARRGRLGGRHRGAGAARAGAGRGACRAAGAGQPEQQGGHGGGGRHHGGHLRHPPGPSGALGAPGGRLTLTLALAVALAFVHGQVLAHAPRSSPDPFKPNRPSAGVSSGQVAVSSTSLTTVFQLRVVTSMPLTTAGLARASASLERPSPFGA